MRLLAITKDHLDVFMLSHQFDRQRDIFQRNAQNFWDGILVQMAFLLPSVQLVTDAWLHPTRSSSSLFGCSQAYPCLRQSRKSCMGVVLDFFDFPRINDIDDVINGDGGLNVIRAWESPSARLETYLCHIRRNDDLPTRSLGKHPSLLIT